MRFTIFHDKPKAPPTSLPTAKKDVTTEDKKTSKNLSWLSRQQPPIHSDTERTNVKLFAQTAPTFHIWRQRNDIEPTIKNSSVKSTCNRSKCCHRPKKTIISYLSNKYPRAKCLLVIKTNKTGTTACYLRRKKFLLNTVRLYQHIKTNNRSVFFGIVYQSANREEQYTLNQKSSYTHPLRHARRKTP